MKKIYLGIATFLFLIIGLSFIQGLSWNYIQYQSIFKIKYKLQQTNDVDYVTVENYGPRADSQHRLYRDLRLNLYLSKIMYVVFLEFMQSQNRYEFIKLFLGSESPYLTPRWKNIQNEVVRLLAQASKEKGFHYTFFDNVLIRWLKGDKGWESFYRTYMGEDEQNATYKLPKPYNPEEVRNDFRRTGCILQFDFVPANNEETIWKVSDIMRIFPNTREVVSLKQYYQDRVIIGAELKAVSPVICLYVPEGTTDWSLKNLMTYFKTALIFNMNLNRLMLVQGLIDISKDTEDSAIVSQDRNNPTIIKLNFYYRISGVTGKVFYISHNIKIWAECRILSFT